MTLIFELIASSFIRSNFVMHSFLKNKILCELNYNLEISNSLIFYDTKRAKEYIYVKIISH